MRSHLLEGKVRHRRGRPFTYQLEHDVWYAALDLDELDEVARRVRLVSRNRANVTVFRDGDHFDPPATDVADAAKAHLRAYGIDPRGWRITLVTNLRTLGHVFNPASFYLCRDPDGDLRVVLIEVHNTHGERRIYTLRPDREGSRHVASMAKDFYVSPFIDMDARYTVRIADDPDRLRITMAETERGEPLLDVGLTVRRRPLTDRVLAGLLVRHPVVTRKTIAAIHWHALRLWRRGARFHRHGRAAGHDPAVGHGPAGPDRPTIQHRPTIRHRPGEAAR